MAAYTIQICELFASFDLDVEWIWRKPLTPTHINFIFMRYGSLAFQTALIYQHFRSTYVPYSDAQCYPWAVMRTMNPYIFIAATQTLLIGRVWNLYHRDKRILIGLLCIFIPGLIVTITSFGILLSKPLTYNNTCDPLDMTNPWVFVFTSFLPFVLDLSMLVLTVRRILRLRKRERAQPLLELVLIDGSWAFFVIWVIVLAAMIFSATGLLFVAYVIANSWLPATVSFTATHLVLNMRRFAHKLELSQDRSPEVTPRDRSFNVAGDLTTGIPVELSAFTRYRRSEPYLTLCDQSKSTLSQT